MRRETNCKVKLMANLIYFIHEFNSRIDIYLYMEIMKIVFYSPFIVQM